MSEASVSGYLSMGSSYLGELSKDLRDLKGYAVFAQELIQNADDAKGNEAQGRATQIIFDITDTECSVWNDGSFSDCGDQNRASEDCLWHQSQGHLCDLHRFRLRASADKRNEEGTTGGFGIGFVSVYQITDHPELHSGNIHWELHPENPENMRVRDLLVKSPEPGTRFIFPWAWDGETIVRRKLALEPVTQERIGAMAQEIAAALPQAILFLRHLEHLELRRNGVTVRKVFCVRDDIGNEGGIHSLIVEDGSDATVWNVLTGEFEEKANALREKHGRLIEQKRQSQVRLALPATASSDFVGLLCATLPTQESSRLPFHINADFYPASNRKRILFEQDYQGEWNAAAVEAAAQCLATHLPQLREKQGAVGIWSLANQAKSLSDPKSRTAPAPCFVAFWEALKTPLSTGEYIQTAADTWVAPPDVYLVKDTQDASRRQKLLIQAGVNTVHPDLRSFYSLLRDHDINVQELSAVSLAKHLKLAGLTPKMAETEAPVWIQSAENRETLAGLIATFGVEANRTWVYDSTTKAALANCALVLSIERSFCLPASCWQASAETQQILSCLSLTYDFALEDNPTPLLALCPPLRLRDIASHLTQLNKEDIEAIWQQSPGLWMDLLSLFEAASAEEWIEAQGWLKQILLSLPIWPSGKNLFPLKELAVPGGFEDPLNLAMLLDKRVIHRCSVLLQRLEPPVLDLSRYAMVELPKQFASGTVVSERDCNELIRVLAKHLGELQDNLAAQKALAQCPLILCKDGTRRTGQQVYLDSDLVRPVLGSSVPIAAAADSKAITDLYRWLGATEMPRGGDVVARIRQICQSPPEKETREVIRRLIASLGQHWDKLKGETDALKPLCTLPWIPAIKRQDIWFEPGKVYAIYSQFLFASQAEFVDLTIQEQNACREFFAFLDIPYQPTSHQIVNHLLACADNNDRVSGQVYTVLQDRLGNVKQHEDIIPALEKLKGKACLSLPDGYVRPNDVYWEKTPFGRYVRHLDEDAWRYRTLFDHLGVQFAPTTENVFQIMERISTEFGTENRRLDEESLAVLNRCWRYLNDRLTATPALHEDISRRLGKHKIIADNEGFLFRPWEMCFEDRPLLAKKFQAALQSRILIREQGVWQAMEATGVHPLSRCVQTRPYLIEGESEVPELTDRLRMRRHLLDRVIEPLAGEKLADWNLTLLDKLRIFRANRLQVGYEVEMRNRIVAKSEETPDVFCDTSAAILYFRPETPPWTALAREIVYALNTEVEAGTTAITLALVLSTPSEEEAENALDEAGFARLERAVERDLPVAARAALDVDASDPEEATSDPPEQKPLSDRESPTSSEIDIEACSESEVFADEEAENGEVKQTEDASRSQKAEQLNDGKDIQSPSSKDTGNVPSTGSSEGNRSGNGHESGKSSSHSHDASAERSKDRQQPSQSNSQGGRLYSYVAPASPEEEQTAADGVQERREAVDIAGIAAVMEYERERGRFPEEMAHNHPGYDILSRDSDRVTVARLIEVKSVPVRWGEKGVGLTATQFHTAEKEGDRFWLYVVECAGTQEARVIPIHNPAGQVGQFYFDSGWKGMAAPEEPPQRMPTLLDLRIVS